MTLRKPRVADFERHQILWGLVAPHHADVGLAHDQAHVLRVYRWSRLLAQEEAIDEDLAGAAGLIHDVVSIPKESRQRPLGGELSATKGAEILPQAGYTQGETAQIVEAVRTCSWSAGQKPTAKLGAVLQDADRLDAIGAIGIARVFACHQEMHERSGGGAFAHPDDPMASSARELDDRAFAVDHFKAKLLKLAGGFHTQRGQQEAQQRHDFLLKYLEQWQNEQHFDSVI